MSPVSFLPALAIVFMALFTTLLISKAWHIKPQSGHLDSIDGLRGYLALFVMLHHASVWFFYLRTGVWEVPPSRLYTHFGQSAVAVFFMITAFLFFSKMLQAQGGGFDFIRLYISRLFRLVPLYLFAMLLMFAIVAILSKGELQESLFVLIKHIFVWVCFTFKGNPDINRVPHTSLIIAGVVWSLRYEWYFYCLLPVFAVFLRIRASAIYLLLSVVGVVALIRLPANVYNLASFAGGIFAACCVRNEALRKFACTPVASGVVVLLVVLTVTTCATAYSGVPMILLTLAFTLIAAGNRLFGALAHPVSLVLGSMAYSIYLLHGLILFVLFNFILEPRSAAALSPLGHWAYVMLVSPIVILMSFAAYRWIERPSLRYVDVATLRVRSWLGALILRWPLLRKWL